MYTTLIVHKPNISDLTREVQTHVTLPIKFTYIDFH